MINKYNEKFLQENHNKIRIYKVYFQICHKMYELKSFKGSYKQFIRNELKYKTNNLEQHYQAFALLEYEGYIKRHGTYLLWHSPKGWIDNQKTNEFLSDNKGVVSKILISCNKEEKKNPDFNNDDRIKIALSFIGEKGLKYRNKKEFIDGFMKTEIGKQMKIALGVECESKIIERKTRKKSKDKLKENLPKKQASAERPKTKLVQQIEDDIS